MSFLSGETAYFAGISALPGLAPALAWGISRNVSGANPEATRVEKVRLFRAIRPLKPREVIRGQFRGYRNEGASRQIRRSRPLLHSCFISITGAGRHPILHSRRQTLAGHCHRSRCGSQAAPLRIFDDIERAHSNYFRFRLGPDMVISAERG
jgi:glucose-6-phosphate 1-dehydrogenase